MDLSELTGAIPKQSDKELENKVEKFILEVDSSPDAFQITNSGKKIQYYSTGFDKRSYELPGIFDVFDGPEPDEFETGKELAAFVEDEYGYTLDSTGLKQVVHDALGATLDEEPPDVRSAKNRLFNAAHGSCSDDTLVLIRGIHPQETVSVNEYVIYSAENFEYYPLSGLLTGIFEEGPAFGHAVVNIELDREIDPSIISEQLRELLQIYSCTTVGTGGIVEQSYGEHIRGRWNDPDSVPTSAHQITEEDEATIENLQNLLTTDGLGSDWHPAIEVAVSHLIHSIDTWAETHQSRTFSIIGLEALYKHFTSGGGASQDVQRFAGFLLSQIGKEVDAVEVREFLNSEYSNRNQLVHGGSISNKSSFDPISEQQELWNYLRVSVVAFAWITKLHEDLLVDGCIPLEDALIDDRVRSDIQTALSELEITEYLSINW